MAGRGIPFRPRLEGDFRIRFYSVASQITKDRNPDEIVDIAKNEIEWVENICKSNFDQRKRYRAVWLLFKDLILANWTSEFNGGVLYMRMPELEDFNNHPSNTPEIKEQLRKWMSESRKERLENYKDFIQRLESPNADGKSILDLLGDGPTLANDLKELKIGVKNVKQVIQPYLQLVDESQKDEYTGLKLSEIWRYFRLTWSNPSENTPGRTLQYLVRDAAHINHPIIGIASLENCAVQITCRDDKIGWNPKSFIEKILKKTSTEVKNDIYQLLIYIEDGLNAINYDGLCNSNEISEPTQETIDHLLQIATFEENKRQNLLRNENINGLENEQEKSDLGPISKDTEVALYTRKRAEQLAKLLSAKLFFQDLLFKKNFEDSWNSDLQSDAGYSAVRNALVAQKSKHIGSSMMELNVCGAIPPYNEILGGKLIALLALSPQIIHDYKVKYQNKPSEIASRLKGEPVVRPADLVYIGTTSLYYVGSSQYNRLSIPGEIFNSDYNIRWEKIGMTIGHGTLHISKGTSLSLSEAVSSDFQRFNHVFGEGSSPKMRLLTTALRELLETNSDDVKEYSKHAMPRIVYGARLAKNTDKYLMGTDESPDYIADVNDFKGTTQKIIDYWETRWLMSRLNFDPVYERIINFDKHAFLIGNELNNRNGWHFKKLEREKYNMEDSESNKTGLDFIRDFYRGSSAFADHIPQEHLNSVHLKTELDNAIIDDLKRNKDVVLTGNAGDGKTHIIRVLQPELIANDIDFIVELDASTISEDEIYHRWSETRKRGKSFLIAINAAILHSVANKYPDFLPLRTAMDEMLNAIKFNETCDTERDVVVYDLSRRTILTKDILSSSINKLTSEDYYQKCEHCDARDHCDAVRNKKLINNSLFQNRLFLILNRVDLLGTHATLRELQALVSYLIFGNKSCQYLMKNSGSAETNIVNLLYSGSGKLFDAIRNSFDPVNISHPILDEMILNNSLDENSWTESNLLSKESLDPNNEKLFQFRKRLTYFFNEDGIKFLEILDDNASKFENFLKLSDKKKKEQLIEMLNSFFGADYYGKKELHIWSGLRYNIEPRKILVSTGFLQSKSFIIGSPKLSKEMEKGIQISPNYIRFAKKDNPDIFLKVDFDMFVLLLKAKNGVPVLFMENDLVKKVWRFMERLQQSIDFEEDDDISIQILDVQNKKEIDIIIDQESGKYSTISPLKRR